MPFYFCRKVLSNLRYRKIVGYNSPTKRHFTIIFLLSYRLDCIFVKQIHGRENKTRVSKKWQQQTASDRLSNFNSNLRYHGFSTEIKDRYLHSHSNSFIRKRVIRYTFACKFYSVGADGLDCIDHHKHNSNLRYRLTYVIIFFFTCVIEFIGKGYGAKLDKQYFINCSNTVVGLALLESHSTEGLLSLLWSPSRCSTCAFLPIWWCLWWFVPEITISTDKPSDCLYNKRVVCRINVRNRTKCAQNRPGRPLATSAWRLSFALQCWGILHFHDVRIINLECINFWGNFIDI